MIEWKVWFREKGPDQQRFHKAFSFVWADSSAGAAERVREVRPGSEVLIISAKPKEVAR